MFMVGISEVLHKKGGDWREFTGRIANKDWKKAGPWDMIKNEEL